MTQHFNVGRWREQSIDIFSFTLSWYKQDWNDKPLQEVNVSTRSFAFNWNLHTMAFVIFSEDNNLFVLELFAS